jgi:predicted unusual protein kinase regulating ubiquinone biosynthesis (AarF/ABC1/UbiB family)
MEVAQVEATNKEKVLSKMNKELAIISDGNYDLRSGENYMTAESVHYAIRKWFLEEHIPELIAGLMANQDEPLERVYDFYVDSGYLTKEVDHKRFIKDYTTCLYYEHLKSILHEKVEREYQQFIEEFKQKSPYDMPKLITEMTVKMQTYSIFRYDDQFDFTERYFENLIPIENILDKVYKASELKSVSTNDLEIVEEEVINSLMNLARTTEEIQAVEDEGYEMD